MIRKIEHFPRSLNSLLTKCQEDVISRSVALLELQRKSFVRALPIMRPQSPLYISQYRDR